jgi:O-antigen ligase
MGIFITALLFTGSKGSIMGLIGGLIVFAFFSKKSKTKWVVGFTILAIVAAGFLLPELNRPSNYRNAIWIKSLLLYKNHPMFGVGLIGIYDRIGEIHSHNIWISLLGMLGIAGFGLYLGMKLYLYNGLLKLKAAGCKLLPFLGAVQALVVAHGMVDFTLMTPQGGIMFIGASGLICALLKPYEQYKSVPLKVPSIPSYSELPNSYELYQKIKAESHQ